MLLTLKTMLFIFIISSPFYNVYDIFFFLDNLPAKVIMLILLICASFIDLQLAIIGAVAYFILLILFNKRHIENSSIVSSRNTSINKIKTMFQAPAPFHMNMTNKDSLLVMGQCTDVGLPDNVATSTEYKVNENGYIPPPHGSSDLQTAPIAKYDKMQTDIDTSNVMHTMYEFPDAKCETPKEANTEYMNEARMLYTLDEKVKPYEDFISQLTNLGDLDNMCNAAILQ